MGVFPGVSKNGQFISPGYCNKKNISIIGSIISSTFFVKSSIATNIFTPDYVIIT